MAARQHEVTFSMTPPKGKGLAMHRQITGRLWQFAWFRLLVLKYVSTGLPGCVWMATETPLMLSLQKFNLDQANFPAAATCAAILRQQDAL